MGEQLNLTYLYTVNIELKMNVLKRCHIIAHIDRSPWLNPSYTGEYEDTCDISQLVFPESCHRSIELAVAYIPREHVSQRMMVAGVLTRWFFT